MNKKVINTMRENAIILLGELLLHKEKFSLVLWNKDNWDKPLPDRIMSEFPVTIMLDFKGDTLVDSYLDKETGRCYISTDFDGTVYKKEVEFDEIHVIMDLDGRPYLVNDFIPASIGQDFMDETGIVSDLHNEGHEIEDIERSVNAFKED
jgi:hypothetical protein